MAVDCLHPHFYACIFADSRKKQPTGVDSKAMKKTIAIATFLLLTLPAALAQNWAKQTLEKSPRHGAWVQIKHDNRVVQAFVVYPESKQKAPVVIVIHEIFGMTDWVRTVADKLAAS